MVNLYSKNSIVPAEDKTAVSLGTTSNLLIQERVMELRENTDFMSTILENLVGHAIIAADFDGNIIAFNEGARQIYGYAPEEVIGKQGIEIFFPRGFIEAGKLQQIETKLLEKGRISWEGEKVRKNGESFPAWIQFAVTRDKSGKVVGFIEIVEDLTERNRVDKRLVDSMSNFYKVIHDDPDGIIITNQQGIVRYVNPAAESLFGRKSEDFNREQFGFPITSNGVTEVNITRQAGETVTAEMRVSETTYYGEIAHLISLHNITERKQAQQALQNSEVKYRRLFEAAQDGILILNSKDGVIEDVNPFLIETLGYSREDFLGKQPWEIKSFKDVELAKSAFMKSQSEDFVHYEDVPIQAKDGKLINVEFISNAYNIEHKKVIQCNIRNITEHKRLERQRELSLSVLTRLNLGGNQKYLIRDLIMLIKDFSGLEAIGIRLREGDDYPYYDTVGFVEGHVQMENRLCTINKNGEVIKDTLGNSALKCMCGNIVCGRFNTDKPFFTKAGSFWTNSTTEFLTTNTQEDRQARTLNRCNEEGYESVALIPLKTDDKVVGLFQLNDTRRDCFTLELIEFYEGISESIRTILERQQAFDVQERLTQQLQAKVSELETFSYGIAHDLRSPLVSIEGFSHLLLEDLQNQKGENVQEDIRLLESGVRKMQGFINSTLEYSRAGHLIKLTENVSFGEIVKEVNSEFAEQISSIGATVSLAKTFPKIHADRSMIKQVLANLIQNSIKYRDKTVPLKIEIGHYLLKKETVFFVRDNGPGIDASEAEKVCANWDIGYISDRGHR
jgi:PAS domain S-box-containing protein